MTVQGIDPDRVTIIDFWAPWCSPCKAMDPILKQLAVDHDVDIVKINVDDNPDIASDWNVSAVPTAFIVTGGEIRASIRGAAPKDKFLHAINEVRG